MKALYKAGRGKESVSLQERPLPTVNETDNVLIRVRACAICGMDHQIYNDRFPCTPPFIMGHEFVGTVEQVLGSASVAPGDRVICEPHMYACGVCDACRSGLPQLCDSRRSVGIQRDGAMAPYIAVPSRYLHKVPDSIPDKLACLLEPFCLLVDNLGIPVQEEHAKTVVVIGGGLVGQFGVIAAKGCGAEQVILCCTHPSFRSEIGQELGASPVLYSQCDDIAARVLEMTDGVGADIVLEASGSESGINAAFAMVKKGGLISVMGGTKRDSVALNWDVCLRKAVRVHFHMMGNFAHMDKAIDIFAHPYTDLTPIVTGEFDLDHWQDAFHVVEERKSIKTVLYIP